MDKTPVTFLFVLSIDFFLISIAVVIEIDATVFIFGFEHCYGILKYILVKSLLSSMNFIYWGLFFIF